MRVNSVANEMRNLGRGETARESAAGWTRLQGRGGTGAPMPRLEHYELRSRALPEPARRDVLVYVPPQYEDEPARRFPVFYLQDAQNLIDPGTSYVPGETWQVHTTADRLAEAGEIEPVILVGVAHAGLRRIEEYTPERDVRHGGGGEGRSYGRLLIEELKPLVDATYRTRGDAVNTGIGGSSLGGLISLYLALERPDVFGKVAAMSPSVWWDQCSILARLKRAVPRPALKIWVDTGSHEGGYQVRDAGMLVRQMQRQGWRTGVDLEYFLAEGAEHNERAWAARFDRVLRFLFPPQTAG
jgi:predicted alpha/beta superfamily hydrolase